MSKLYGDMTAKERLARCLPSLEHSYPRHPMLIPARAGDVAAFCEATKHFTYDMDMAVCGVADKFMFE
jgi:hypothetical protein